MIFRKGDSGSASKNLQCVSGSSSSYADVAVREDGEAARPRGAINDLKLAAERASAARRLQRPLPATAIRAFNPDLLIACPENVEVLSRRGRADANVCISPCTIDPVDTTQHQRIALLDK